MAGEWSEATIEEVAERVAMGPFGSSIKVETFVSSGVPVISGQHLRGSKIDDRVGFNFVSEEHASRLKNANVLRGDVIFTHAGNIGQAAFVPESSKFERYVISQRQFYMRCNRAKVLPEFVVAYFKTAEGLHQLLANTSQVDVPSIAQPVTYLRTIAIPLPPLPEQRAIAHILGTLDDKIELNRRINDTLEAMARALFKSWFVDFDPVRAKAEGRDPGLPKPLADLFPARLVTTEIGAIPEGWEVKVLDDLAGVVLGGDWGVDEPSLDHTERARCIRGADIPDLQAGGVGKMPVRYLKLSSLKKRRLSEGDLVVEISGGSPTQSTGRPVLVSDGLLQRLDAPLVCSNFCRLLRPKKRVYSKPIYLWLRALYSADEFLQFENGTTGIKNLAFTLFSSRYKLCMPSDDVLAAFGEKVAPAFARQQSTAAEANSLATLRDVLLPKLISGQIRLEGMISVDGRHSNGNAEVL